MGEATYQKVIGAELTLDTSQLKRSITETKRELTTLRKNFVAQTAGLDQWANAVELVEKRHDYLGRRLELQRKIYSSYNRILEQTNQGTTLTHQGQHKLKQSFADAEAAIKYTEAELQNYNKSLDAARQKQELVEGAAKNMGKGFTVLKGILTNLATKVIYSTIRALGSAHKEFVAFDAALADVQKVSRASVDEIAALANELGQMVAGGKALPTLASDLAEIATQGARLGIASQDLAKFAATIQKVGDISTLTTEEAGTMMARIGAITGMKVSQYERFASTLFRLSNNFATTEKEVLTIALRLSGAAKTIGMSEQEMLGFSAVLSAIGIEAERGGTAFTKLVKKIELAVATKKGLGEIANVAGMAADRFAALWLSSPAEGLMRFLDGLRLVDEAGGSTIKTLADLGWTEIRMTDMVQKLALANDKLGKALGIANEAWRENTGLTEATAIQYGTLESKAAVMKNTFTESARAWEEALKPTYEMVLKILTAIGEASKSAATYSRLADIARKQGYWPGIKQQKEMGLEKPVEMRGATAYPRSPALMTEPERALFAREIEERSKTGLGPIAREWKEILEGKGLVEEAISGLLPGSDFDKRFSDLAEDTRNLFADLGDVGAMGKQELTEAQIAVEGLAKAMKDAGVASDKSGQVISDEMERVSSSIQDRIDIVDWLNLDTNRNSYLGQALLALQQAMQESIMNGMDPAKAIAEYKKGLEKLAGEQKKTLARYAAHTLVGKTEFGEEVAPQATDIIAAMTAGAELLGKTFVEQAKRAADAIHQENREAFLGFEVGGEFRSELEAAYRPLTDIQKAAADIEKLEVAIAAARAEGNDILADELEGLKAAIEFRKEQLETEQREREEKRKQREADDRAAEEAKFRAKREREDRKRAALGYLQILSKTGSLKGELMPEALGTTRLKEMEDNLKKVLSDARQGLIELTEAEEAFIKITLDSVQKTVGNIKNYIAGLPKDLERLRTEGSKSRKTVSTAQREYDTLRQAQQESRSTQHFLTDLLGRLPVPPAAGEVEVKADVTADISKILNDLVGNENFAKLVEGIDLSPENLGKPEVVARLRKRTEGMEKEADEAADELWAKKSIRGAELFWLKKAAPFSEAIERILNPETFAIKPAVEMVFDSLTDLWDKVAAGVGTLVGQISDIWQSYYSLKKEEAEKDLEAAKKRHKDELDSFDEAHRREEDSLKAQLESGELSQAKYYSELARLRDRDDRDKAKLESEQKAREADLKAEKDAAERKLFEGEKANAIAQIWINAAQGVAKVWSEFAAWPILAGAISLATMAMAGVQTNLVNQRQFTPSLAKGGVVDEPTYLLAGEAGKEAIVPLENNLEWIDALAGKLATAIEGASVRLGGATYNQGTNYQYDITQVIQAKPKTKREIYKATVKAIAYNGRR